MKVWWRINALLMSLVPLFSLWAEHVYRRMNALPRSSGTTLPPLSIIVPARDEAQNLRRLLPSLTALRYPGQCEIIVVDDGSTDETSAVARTHGARLLRLNELTPGWLGKPNACHQGALSAQSEWLLFTDADTVHSPDGAGDAVAHVLDQQWDGLSLLLGHETSSRLTKTALIVAFAGLYVGMRPGSPMLNGQYILISRDAYFSSGGFAAVRNQPLEDVALGHHLRSLGFRLPMLAGGRIARVQMYNNRRHLWQGLSRLGAGSLRWSGLGAFRTALYVTGAMLPLLGFLLSLFGLQNRRNVLLMWAATTPGFVPWSRRFGSAWLALSAPIGATFVQLAACWGLIRHWFGRGINWKNRMV